MHHSLRRLPLGQLSGLTVESSRVNSPHSASCRGFQICVWDLSLLFLLFPAGRFAHVFPILLCPAYVSFAGYVLPSSPSPCGGLSPPPITMLDTTPTQPEFLHVSFGSPSWFCDILRVTPSPVSGFPLRASISSSHICAQELNGPPKFLCASLHTCHGLRTPPVLHILAFNG